MSCCSVFVFRLYDIGLRQQTKTRLLLELLIPTIFSIVIVVQLHFFHKPLMNKINRLLRYRRHKQRLQKQHSDTITTTTTIGGITSAEDQPTETATSSTTNQQSVSDESDDEVPQGLMEKIIFAYKYMTMILWRIAEIHWSKIISFVVILVSLQQVV